MQQIQHDRDWDDAPAKRRQQAIAQRRERERLDDKAQDGEHKKYQRQIQPPAALPPHADRSDDTEWHRKQRQNQVQPCLGDAGSTESA
jgi:hypothetical protein